MTLFSLSLTHTHDIEIETLICFCFCLSSKRCSFHRELTSDWVRERLFSLPSFVENISLSIDGTETGISFQSSRDRRIGHWKNSASQTLRSQLLLWTLSSNGQYPLFLFPRSFTSLLFSSRSAWISPWRSLNTTTKPSFVSNSGFVVCLWRDVRVSLPLIRT